MTPSPRASRTHARFTLDEVIHAPVRFSIVAALNGVASADFATVRDAVEVTDSTLSKQVSTLEKAGYVKGAKGYIGKRPKTTLSLTSAGRKAFERHLAALRAIAEPHGAAASDVLTSGAPTPDIPATAPDAENAPSPGTDPRTA